MPITTTNPSTGQLIKTFDELSDSELKDKLDVAQSQYETWSCVPMAERVALVAKLAEVLKKNDRKYAEIISTEMGMPIFSSIKSIAKCAWNCEYLAEHAEVFLQPEMMQSDAGKSYVRFDPLGIILLVMPWNFPFWQVIRQAIPNVLVGNTVVLKHASNVPQCALAIEDAFHEAGFPHGVFQTLLIGSEKVETVLKDFRVKGVSLTGSVQAGSKVASIAGREIKRQVMELGGSDPFIVLADANVSLACDVGTTSRMINSGQSCIAAKRFIVVEEKYEEFITMQKTLVEKLIVGNAMNEDTHVGPLSSERAREDIDVQVLKCIDRGARLITGGKKIDGNGFFYTPTILADVIHGMPGYDEEVFGPVVSVIRAKDTEDAIRIANDTKFGLGASLWTEDVELAETLVPRINAGAVFVNGMVKSDPRLPFGGINYGGYGRELGRYGLLEFVNMKTVWIR